MTQRSTKTRWWAETFAGTFKNDFGKYGNTIKHQRPVTLHGKIPVLVGSRFRYVTVDRTARAADTSRLEGRCEFDVWMRTLEG